MHPRKGSEGTQPPLRKYWFLNSFLSSRKSCWVFRSWETEGVLKHSLWRFRFGSYCGKPVDQEIFNWQGLVQLKYTWTAFKLFHARMPCFLFHLLLGSFICVLKLALEGSGMSSPAIKKRWLHPWDKKTVTYMPSVSTVTLHCLVSWLMYHPLLIHSQQRLLSPHCWVSEHNHCFPLCFQLPGVSYLRLSRVYGTILPSDSLRSFTQDCWSLGRSSWSPICKWLPISRVAEKGTE